MKTYEVTLKMEIASEDSQETVLAVVKAVTRLVLLVLNARDACRDIVRVLWKCAKPWWLDTEEGR